MATCVCGAEFTPKRRRVRGGGVTQFCSRGCVNKSPGGLQTTFWKRVEKTETCWLWRGTLNAEGYGRFRVGSRDLAAHRLALGLSGIAIPIRSRVLHRCDTPACVNPNHLFLGDQLDNVIDMLKKKRDVVSKLSHDQVREIRRRIAAGAKQRDIAAEYKVNTRNIKTGETWAWL